MSMNIGSTNRDLAMSYEFFGKLRTNLSRHVVGTNDYLFLILENIGESQSATSFPFYYFLTCEDSYYRFSLEQTVETYNDFKHYLEIYHPYRGSQPPWLESEDREVYWTIIKAIYHIFEDAVNDNSTVSIV